MKRLLSVFSSFRYPFREHSTRFFVWLFTVGFGLSLLVSACSPDAPTESAPGSDSPSATSSVTVRVGYQKAATILNALKGEGTLEKAFAGGSVEWVEFPAGPPMLEAMNAGSIDFGYTGESPPIIAQAAGTPVRYVAYDPWTPKAEAIVVPANSSIASVAELKGKKVAFAKGSNTNYLVVKALESAGLKYTDIEPAFLTPADARAAFEGGNVDAWAIWDPYLAVAEESIGAKQLVDATGLAPNRGYYLAAQSFIDQNPDALKTLLAEVKKVSDWAAGNSTEVAKFLEPQLGIPADVLEKAEKRREYDVLPLTDEVIDAQQQIADTFLALGLIPKQINIREAVWSGN